MQRRKDTVAATKKIISPTDRRLIFLGGVSLSTGPTIALAIFIVDLTLCLIKSEQLSLVG
jgi:hypothetical protein